MELLDGEVAGGQGPKEPDLGVPTQAATRDVCHLGDTKRGNRQRAGVPYKEFLADRMLGIRHVQQRDQWPRIN